MINLFESIYKFQEDSDDYSSLRLIYKTMFDLLDHDKLDPANEILESINVDKINLTNLIGFLTITKEYQDLPGRTKLLEQVIQKIQTECPEDEADLMCGL